ncbi:ubiquitin-conjugating enzyme E2 15 [Drechslerella stenobrocha 248]|uniref:Ubiquitin-conjugating enzyme E2 2 n=1 Tax=Drechslerella stenobrocha 248 TaxID=1043628 RepID=W7IAL1_9PEZI|nr:ubiquitin-conjugating enzyme E2 15 [Drechslerella stenobrocha 248]
MSSATASAALLKRQLKEMRTSIPGISCGLHDDDIYDWEEYPLMPPKMKFETPIWHPNIYENGTVCISILHPPEEDKYGYESAAERWLPVHTPETILLSVISMLSSPNDESPANIDAAKQWREDPAGFKKRARKCVRDTLEA